MSLPPEIIHEIKKYVRYHHFTQTRNIIDQELSNKKIYAGEGYGFFELPYYPYIYTLSTAKIDPRIVPQLGSDYFLLNGPDCDLPSKKYHDSLHSVVHTIYSISDSHSIDKYDIKFPKIITSNNN